MLAGSRTGDLVPFLCLCTTGEVAKRLGPYGSASSCRRSKTPLHGDVPRRPSHLLTLTPLAREVVQQILHGPYCLRINALAVAFLRLTTP